MPSPPLPINTAWMARYVLGGNDPLVNNIVFLWQNPCGASSTAYFETLFPAAGDALITFLTFGWDDVLRGAIRPKGTYCIRRKSKKARGKPGVLRQLLTDDVGNNIGKHIPGSQTIRVRSSGPTYKFLWRLDGAMQRGFFWWMVAGIVNDFLIEWSSGIIENSCEPGTFDWEGMCARVFLIGGPLGGWFYVVMYDTIKQINCGADLGAIGILIHYRGFVYGELRGFNDSQVEGIVSLGIAFDADVQHPVASTTSGKIPPGGRFSLTIGAHVVGPLSVALVWKITTGTFTADDGFIVGSGTII